MLWGADGGALELRRSGDGSVRLEGVFPYGRPAVLDGGGGSGPRREEVVASRAFAGRIDAGEDVHFLAGHDYEKPLASRSAGTLELRDGAAALELVAVIGPELARVSYVADLLASHAAGLIRGLSPGFRVPAGGEAVERRDGAVVRTIAHADLYELSAVTRPAYPAAQIEARRWSPCSPAPVRRRAITRWRA